MPTLERDGETYKVTGSRRITGTGPRFDGRVKFTLRRESDGKLFTWFPSYSISNLGGTIGQTRDRLKRLQREQETGPRDRFITARFDSSCTDCGADLRRGDSIRYNRVQGARCGGSCGGGE